MSAGSHVRWVLALTFCATLGTGSFCSARPRADEPALADVLQRMGRYVSGYGEQAALLVAVERYTQRMATDDDSAFRPRQLAAEVALVRTQDGRWIGFRDVVEVDGRKIPDRRDRLLRLLSRQDGNVDEARRISDESARFNVGPVQRNFNVPTTVLFFFRPESQRRFSFTRGAVKTVDGVTVWVLDFVETGRPTLMVTRAGKDVPCAGSVWVVPTDGTIVRTRLRLKGFADERWMEPQYRAGSGEPRQQPTAPAASTPAPTSASTQAPGQAPGQGAGQGKTGSTGSTSTTSVDHSVPQSRSALEGLAPPKWGDVSGTIESGADVEVTYRRDPSLGLWVPAKMSETYDGAFPQPGNKPPLRGRATCLAEYADYKRFTTSATLVVPK